LVRGEPSPSVVRYDAGHDLQRALASVASLIGEPSRAAIPVVLLEKVDIVCIGSLRRALVSVLQLFARTPKHAMTRGDEGVV
jgi:hypothetical protein